MLQFQAALAWTLPHLTLGTTVARSIRVGFLSERVIRGPTDVVMFPPGSLPVQTDDDPAGSADPATMNGMSRGALQITVTANRRDVRLVTCHLTSKLLSSPGGRCQPVSEDERARHGADVLNRRTTGATTVRHGTTATIHDRGIDEPFALPGDTKRGHGTVHADPRRSARLGDRRPGVRHLRRLVIGSDRSTSHP